MTVLVDKCVEQEGPGQSGRVRRGTLRDGRETSPEDGRNERRNRVLDLSLRRRRSRRGNEFLVVEREGGQASCARRSGRLHAWADLPQRTRACPGTRTRQVVAFERLGSEGEQSEHSLAASRCLRAASGPDDVFAQPARLVRGRDKRALGESWTRGDIRKAGDERMRVE